ncbi:disease resistance response protein 206-like [Momordica charantia]|uniref:Dirigent protein n=1 Tax=Momordica charantia TaxID=3673 RepID=A0A6J1C530_MOMCH|nr:disease resistance response protein 206-like [Momordica charantia]
MASSTKSCTIFIIPIAFLFLFASSSSSSAQQKPQPCKQLLLYFHDFRFNGSNAQNATSAIVAAPQGANLTTLATPQFHFGDVVVFDDPITSDNNLYSELVGRAQGLYIYDDKSAFSAWFGFTFNLNSTAYQGTISLVGADLAQLMARDISVIGGTGDFFMHRGIATIFTDALEGQVYFRLRFDIKFYECW